jgi:folate-dependent phosphoribosylglycinamide formyltransferase PurN
VSRIVILAAPGRSTNIVFHAIERRFGVHTVILENPVSRAELLKRRWKKLGTRRVVGQVLFQLAVVPPLAKTSETRIREILARSNLDDAPIPEHKIRRVGSVNEDATRSLLRELDPALVVINGTRIISKATLGAVRARFLNMHVGVTPLYRGVHGGYWALVERDRERCGVTVYVVDPGIDTGNVIAQAKIDPTDRDNFTTYPVLQLEAGMPLLIRAIDDSLAGKLETKAHAEGPSKLWYHPTLGEYLWNRVRRGVK